MVTIAEARGRLLARKAAYRERHRQDINEKARLYREAHREQIRERQNARRSLDPEAARTRLRAYHAAHPELARRRVREWRKANPEKARDKARRDYAKRMGAPTCSHPACRLIGASILSWSRWPHQCYICERPLMSSAPLGAVEFAEFDHVVPIARGGVHCADNLRPCCRPCNNAKGAS